MNYHRSNVHNVNVKLKPEKKIRLNRIRTQVVITSAILEPKQPDFLQAL